MPREFFFLKVRFRGRFTSYSPAIQEGFLDSTTLHAALVSAASLAGFEIEGSSLVVSSLLPIIECHEDKALLPSLRIPGSNKVKAFWTPEAAREALRAILRAPADSSKEIAALPRRDPCEGRQAPETILLRIGDKVKLRLSRTSGVIHLPEEVECVRTFRPPRVSRHHRLAIDRPTQASIPLMYRVVEASNLAYWAAGFTSDCSVLEVAAAIIKKTGLGALRSTGHGSLTQVTLLCGEEARKQAREMLRGLSLAEASNVVGVLLGLFKPADGSLQAYGEVWEYGSHRGYGGFLQSFRRPLVRALAPGSVIVRAPHPAGLIYRDPEGLYVYSFHTMVAGVT